MTVVRLACAYHRLDKSPPYARFDLDILCQRTSCEFFNFFFIFFFMSDVHAWPSAPQRRRLADEQHAETKRQVTEMLVTTEATVVKVKQH